MSLIACGQLASGKPVSADSVCDLLRSHAGEDVSVTAGKTGVFLYAATADAAATAEAMAQEVLARQGLAADIRLQTGGTRLARSGCRLVMRLPPSCRQGRSVTPAAGACARRAVVAAIFDGLGNADF